MLRRTAPLLLSLALLSACGGEDGTATATTPSPTASATPAGLTKAEFVAKAEAVCSDAVAEIESVPEPTGPDDAQASFTATLAVASTSTTELERLAAAQPDAAELEEIFTGPLRENLTVAQEYFPKLIEAFAALAESAQSGQAPEFPELPEMPELKDPDVEAMKAYGFDRCIKLAEQEE